jgi:murein tripeptide amidase MpaA
MALFSVLKLIHGGIVHQNTNDKLKLAQNKYYVVPSVNVDGVAYIEDIFKSNGTFVEKRTNMHILNTTCSVTKAGVDLNRNYAYLWGKFTD